jgi:hypothetical protein
LIPLKHCHLNGVNFLRVLKIRTSDLFLAMIAGKGIADRSLRKPCILLLDVYRSKFNREWSKSKIKRKNISK